MRSTLRELHGERSFVRRRVLSLVFFAIAMFPLAVVVHLFAEGVGIGAGALLASLFTRHAYLCIAGIASLGLGLAAASSLLEPGKRLLCLRLIASELPYRDNRVAFVGFCAVFQLIVFGGAQGLEGNPIARGAGLAAWSTATLLSFAAALLLDAVPQRMVRLVAAIYCLRRVDWTVIIPSNDLRQFARFLSCLVRSAYRSVVGSRPPPPFQHAFSR
jgi:hypothetical protein